MIFRARENLEAYSIHVSNVGAQTLYAMGSLHILGLYSYTTIISTRRRKNTAWFCTERIRWQPLFVFRSGTMHILLFGQDNVAHTTIPIKLSIFWAPIKVQAIRLFTLPLLKLVALPNKSVPTAMLHHYPASLQAATLWPLFPAVEWAVTGDRFTRVNLNRNHSSVVPKGFDYSVLPLSLNTFPSFSIRTIC